MQEIYCAIPVKGSLIPKKGPDSQVENRCLKMKRLPRVHFASKRIPLCMMKP